MADVGRLRWIVSADTRQFESGMARAGRGLARLGRLAAGVMGVRGLSAGMAAGLKTADAIGKISRAAGVSVEDIQQLRFAFREAGGEVGEFDRLLLRFNRNLGDLSTRHAGPLAEFLRKTDTGLFVALKRAQSATEAFLLLSDAVAKLSPQGQQALLGAAFGRPSTAMTVMQQGGRAGIRASMGRLPRGELISEAMVREAERANDEMLRLQERAMIHVTKAAVSVVGFVQDIRKQMGGSEGQHAMQQWMGEQFPWTMRALRFRGMIGRLWD